jgi:hypothetical protein
MPKHIRYECSGGHDYLGCQFCDGGLFACTVCGGFEGSLPTDCPGFKMTEEQEHRVYRGLLDYRDGREWGCPDGTGKSMGDVDVQVKEIKRRRDESIRDN